MGIPSPSQVPPYGTKAPAPVTLPPCPPGAGAFFRGASGLPVTSFVPRLSLALILALVVYGLFLRVSMGSRSPLNRRGIS
jgi:hypothetical protein